VESNNIYPCLTGCSSDNPPSYASHDAVEVTEASGCKNPYHTTIGQMASTTGNIYGVYDMVGGSHEYVMANYNKNKGKSLFQDNLANLEAKYYNLYTYTLTKTATYDPFYKATVCSSSECLGYAMSETKGWGKNQYGYPDASTPWMGRGGNNWGAWSDIFAFYGYTELGSATGGGSTTLSSRLTVASLS